MPWPPWRQVQAYAGNHAISHIRRGTSVGRWYDARSPLEANRGDALGPQLVSVIVPGADRLAYKVGAADYALCH